MKSDSQTPKVILQEVEDEGYFQRARRRAQRRKSPWNLALIPLVLAGISATSYLLFHIMWRLHIAIYPNHAGSLGEFWGKGIGFPSFISSFLLLMPLLFLSMPISMLLANCVMWLIPSARRTFHQESEGIKLASFAESVVGLWRVCKIIVPIGLLLSMVGAVTLTNLR